MIEKIKLFDERMNQHLDKVPVLGKVNRWCDRHRRSVVAVGVVLLGILGFMLAKGWVQP